MPRDSLTLNLMCRNLNALWQRVQRAHPHASRKDVELAMADVLHRLGTVETALGKEWMQWFPPRLPPRKSGARSARPLR